jgi:hypothetical protein
MPFDTRFNPDEEYRKLKERVDTRKKLRKQMLQDQATNAKRDDKSLAAERRWFEQNRGKA